MALEYVNISTLLVLVAESGRDFQNLVNTTGAVNDPSGDKDKWNLPEVIQGGTFKSHLLDQFPSLNADKVSISACNKNGEILWTTHFSITGESLAFLDSLRGNSIITSSTANAGNYNQSVKLSYNKYSTVIHPGEVLTDLAWFAVTNGNVIDDPHPMIFYAKETSVPFRLPQIREGYEGCWPSTSMNVALQSTGPTSGSDCASLCKSLKVFSVAAISVKTQCHCGNYLEGATGRNDPSCFLTCDLNATQTCGSFSTSSYSNYYVPGTAEYMTLAPDLIYYQYFVGVGPDLQIDIPALQPSTGDPAVVTNLSVASDSGSPYTIHYNDRPCGQEQLKQHPVTSNDTVTYLSNGSRINVGLLHVRCLQIHFSSSVLNANVSLFGPTGSYVRAYALVVRAYWLGEGSTTEVSSPSTSESISLPLTDLVTNTTPAVTASSAPTASTSSITPLSTDTTTGTTSVSDSPSSEETSTYTSPTRAGTTCDITTNDLNSPAQTTYPSSNTTSNICFCDCRLVQHRSNLTDQELEAIVFQIKRQLSVNKTELSSNIRKKTSASDSRTSAISIGIVGVVLLVAVFGTIFVMDIPTILKDFVQLFRNLRQVYSTSYEK